jgi:hypothetical protein
VFRARLDRAERGWKVPLATSPVHLAAKTA